MLIVAIPALFLAGCIATTSGYQQMVDSWVGAPENALIAQVGPPDRVYSSGGSKYLTYVASGAAYMPPVAPSYTTTVIGNTAYTNPYGGSPGYNISLNCETTFMVRGETIQSVSFKGNNCVAIPPPKA